MKILALDLSKNSTGFAVWDSLTGKVCFGHVPRNPTPALPPQPKG